MGRVRHINGRSLCALALIADTHGVLNKSVANRIRNFDCIVHAGDVGCGGGLGRGLGVLPKKSFAVLGNNDTAAKWPLLEHGFLEKLPETLTIDLAGGELVVIHGHQFSNVKTRHEDLRDKFPNAKAILYGHSHRAVIDKSTRPWVLNPGASGNVRTFGGPSFIQLKISGAKWYVRLQTFERR